MEIKSFCVRSDEDLTCFKFLHKGITRKFRYENFAGRENFPPLAERLRKLSKCLEVIPHVPPFLFLVPLRKRIKVHRQDRERERWSDWMYLAKGKLSSECSRKNPAKVQLVWTRFFEKKSKWRFLINFHQDFVNFSKLAKV